MKRLLGKCSIRALVCLVQIKALFILSGCSGLFYQPDRSLYFLPSKLGLQAEELALKAPDGSTIYAWYFPAKSGGKPKGTLVQFHGNAENMSSHYLSLAWLIRQGYNLYVFDYRGYGKSEGEPSQQNTYEDGLVALKSAYSLHQKSGASRFVVVGQSLGGAIAARVLQDFEPKAAITAVVLDSTFSSYKRVAVKTLARNWYTWPLSWLGWVLVSDAYSSEDALRQCTYRLLLIHDRRDPVVPFDCAERIQEQASCPVKELWALDQGGHIAAFADDQSETRQRFLEFLDRLPAR